MWTSDGEFVAWGQAQLQMLYHTAYEFLVLLDYIYLFLIFIVILETEIYIGIYKTVLTFFF